MLFRRKSTQDDLDKRHKEAEVLKATTIKETKKAKADIARLNRLLLANGISLRIYIATGGDKRGH